MGNYYRVNIKKDVTILFPKYCVICGKLCGDEKITIAGSSGGSFWHWKETFKSTPELIIPGHVECNNILKKKLSNIDIMAFSFSIIPVIIFTFFRWKLDIWTLLLFVALAYISGKTIECFYCQEPILFSKDDDKMSFLLKELDYANEFAELNKESLYKEIILDSGEPVKKIWW